MKLLTKPITPVFILLAISFASAPARSQVLESAPHASLFETRSQTPGVSLRSEPVLLGRLAQAMRENASSPEEQSSAQGEAQERSRRYGSQASQIVSDSVAPFAVVAGLYLLADNKNHGGQARGAIEGMGASMLATTILKRVVRSERPRGGPHSFPSGHATIAFAVASSVSYNHRNTRIPLLAVATAIAASRVDLRAHRVRDVVAGAAIGYYTTRFFMRRNRDESPSNTLTASAPFPPTARPGLNLSTRGVSFSRGF